MSRALSALVGIVVIAGMGAFGCATTGSWQKDFAVSDCEFVATGRNQYFILEPGFQLVLEDENETLVVTVLDETREVDGVLTRVVEEREWRKGQLKEVSRNFFALCGRTQDVYYFGEEVDMYRRGRVVNHKGAWLAGENGAKAGLMMPGSPRVGLKYYQEVAPSVAMDRAEIVKLDDTMVTPAGTFQDCLRTKEGTALGFFSFFVREFKTYAPGIGLIQDAKLRLTRYGFVEGNR